MIFALFCSCELDLDPMTFIGLYELDPYLIKMYQQTKDKLHTSSLSKVIVSLSLFVIVKLSLQTYNHKDKHTTTHTLHTATEAITTPLRGFLPRCM